MDKKISIADIKEIIELVRSEGKIESFTFKQGDTEISISKNGPVATGSSQQLPGPAPVAALPVETEQQMPAPVVGVNAAADALSVGDIAIKAPLVGTFYCSSKPGAEPFVKEGQTVKQGDTLCIVEVMKLMNSVKAESSGTIKKVMVQDGDPVEYGQTLMVIGA